MWVSITKSWYFGDGVIRMNKPHGRSAHSSANARYGGSDFELTFVNVGNRVTHLVKHLFYWQGGDSRPSPGLHTVSGLEADGLSFFTKLRRALSAIKIYLLASLPRCGHGLIFPLV